MCVIHFFFNNTTFIIAHIIVHHWLCFRLFNPNATPLLRQLPKPQALLHIGPKSLLDYCQIEKSSLNSPSRLLGNLSRDYTTPYAYQGGGWLSRRFGAIALVTCGYGSLAEIRTLAEHGRYLWYTFAEPFLAQYRNKEYYGVSVYPTAPYQQVHAESVPFLAQVRVRVSEIAIWIVKWFVEGSLSVMSNGRWYRRACESVSILCPY